MSYAPQLLDTYPSTLNANASVLAATIEALSDCIEACIVDTGADERAEPGRDGQVHLAVLKLLRCLCGD